MTPSRDTVRATPAASYATYDSQPLSDNLQSLHRADSVSRDASSTIRERGSGSSFGTPSPSSRPTSTSYAAAAFFRGHPVAASLEALARPTFQPHAAYYQSSSQTPFGVTVQQNAAWRRSPQAAAPSGLASTLHATPRPSAFYPAAAPLRPQRQAITVPIPRRRALQVLPAPLARPSGPRLLPEVPVCKSDAANRPAQVSAVPAGLHPETPTLRAALPAAQGLTDSGELRDWQWGVAQVAGYARP